MSYIQFGHLPQLDFSCNEALNSLATNLSFCGENLKTILITSRYAYEGKSFITMNLMRTLASLQKRVVLLDTDLRRSKMMSQYSIRFAEGQHMGLAHYLSGKCEMQDIVYATNIENAYFVPIGREVSSSLQLLSSSRLAPLMQALREDFDVVLIDTPPVGLISDALEMAKYSDGALLVVSCNRGTKKDIREAVNALRQTNCRVLGSVMNNVDFHSFTSKRYYYRSEKYASYYKKGYTAYKPVAREKR